MDEVLVKLFEKSQKTLTPGSIFVWSGCKDTSGHLYGSHKYFKREDLEHRTYEVIRRHNSVDLLFTDVVFDRKLWKAVPINEMSAV